VGPPRLVCFFLVAPFWIASGIIFRWLPIRIYFHSTPSFSSSLPWFLFSLLVFTPIAFAPDLPRGTFSVINWTLVAFLQLFGIWVVAFFPNCCVLFTPCLTWSILPPFLIHHCDCRLRGSPFKRRVRCHSSPIWPPTFDPTLSRPSSSDKIVTTF